MLVGNIGFLRVTGKADLVSVLYKPALNRGEDFLTFVKQKFEGEYAPI